MKEPGERGIGSSGTGRSTVPARQADEKQLFGTIQRAQEIGPNAADFDFRRTLSMLGRTS
jgi:hypothetical protein